ncbi:MAG TPA: hypothetical protein VLW50_11010 [Streptosporangiaceae bacterium]|nr:hypothetical protein [Streptosporangiaceae bacterium]
MLAVVPEQAVGAMADLRLGAMGSFGSFFCRSIRRTYPCYASAREGCLRLQPAMAVTQGVLDDRPVCNLGAEMQEGRSAKDGALGYVRIAYHPGYVTNP